MTQPKLWTKDFIVAALLNFLLVLVFYLLVVVIGHYATTELNATVSQAGLAVGMFVVGVLAGRLAIGQYIDKLGRKRSMTVGLFMSIITCLMYFVEAGITYLIVVRFLHGLAVGFAATATATVVAYLIPTSRRGEGVGYFSMSTSLSTAIGPFIGIFLTQHAHFSAVLVVCSVLSTVSLAVSFLLTVPEASVEDRAKSPRRFSFKQLLEPKAVPLCSLMFFFAAYYSGVLSYLNVYSIERDLVEPASFFFLAYSCSILASRPITGRLIDLHGSNLVMYPAILAMALGFYCLSSATTGALLLTAGALIGFGFGNIQSCMQAVAVKLVDSHRMGLATTTFFIFMDAGLGFGPYLLGFVAPLTGYSNLYLICSVLILINVFFYHWVHGKPHGRSI